MCELYIFIEYNTGFYLFFKIIVLLFNCGCLHLPPPLPPTPAIPPARPPLLPPHLLGFVHVSFIVVPKKILFLKQTFK